MLALDQLPTSNAWHFLDSPACLELSNTANWHAAPQPVESLHSYTHLLSWSLAAGLLREDEAARLQQAAAERPAEAAAVLARAIELREAIYRVFSSLARGRSAPAGDLAAINAEAAEALGKLRVVANEAHGDGFAWAWADADALARPLWPVARSAAELLTSPDDLPRVRECAGDPCGWLFLDTSRNRSRRWCRMETCGNRAKARRHYERARGTKG